MSAVLPFPTLTAEQRQVLHEISDLAAEFGVPARKVRRVYLDEIGAGRSTAVAVAQARRHIHRPDPHDCGPSAA